MNAPWISPTIQKLYAPNFRIPISYSMNNYLLWRCFQCLKPNSHLETSPPTV